jgi:hypothetical protein
VPDSILLPALTEKARAAAVAKATAETWLSNLGDDPELWRNVEIMDKKAKDAGGKSYYYYSRHRITVNTCYWGENEDRLVLVFSAPYLGELPIWEMFIQTHDVYYYVNEDNSLTWANEDGAALAIV